MAKKFHGEVLEKHIIAQGTFGVVEKIKFKSDPEKYIACKTIISDTDNGSTKEVIEREYKILSFLNHPNIVRYEWFEWLQNPPGAKLYMEYCEGGNLDTYIKKRNSSKENTSEEFVWKLVAQLASALMYCHHGVTTANEPINPKWGRILHRDIKPGNVFLAGDSNVDVQVKLGDFGLGVILQDGNADTYVGTKQYLAPEINRAESEISWSEKCDIFSLGCTLYALCNGSTPFDYRMDSPNEIKPEAFSEEYSPTLRDFTIECLSFKPEARPDAIKIHTIAEDQLSTIGPPGGYRPPQALVAHGKGHLLPGAPIAATSWPGWHFRVYFQDSSGGIREAKHDMGEWTGGDTKSVICHARLFTPLAVVSSSTGKEIRLFYLNENNTLQEHYYSTISGWRSGSLNKLKIKASPQSRITALWLPAGVRVFYQEPTKNALQEYYMDTGTTWWKRLRWSRGTWRKGKTLSANALKGTSLASATWGGGSMRLYYQDTTLELREHCCDGPSRGWYVGHLAAGTIPKYSPISSFAWSGQHNGVQVRVYWHDKSKNLVELSWDGGWQPVKEVLFMGTTQFCAVQWDNGSHIRAYHQGSDHAIMEKCFSNTGDWYNGTRVDRGAQD